MFCSCFARVLLAFCSRFARVGLHLARVGSHLVKMRDKVQNVSETKYSVIMPLFSFSHHHYSKGGILCSIPF